MTDAQLRDEVMTLFLAGQETTALALSWTWYLLAEHPRSRRQTGRRIADELGDRPLTVEDVPRLKYAEAVINESMRLHPPAYRAGPRGDLHDVTIAGHRCRRAGRCSWPNRSCTATRAGGRSRRSFVPSAGWTARRRDLPKFAYFPFGGGPAGLHRQHVRHDGNDRRAGRGRPAISFRADRP